RAVDLDGRGHSAVAGEVLVFGKGESSTARTVPADTRSPARPLCCRLDHTTGARVLQVAETEVDRIGARCGRELVDEGLEREHVRVAAARPQRGGAQRRF